MGLYLWLSAALLVGSVQASVIDSGSITQAGCPGLCINISSTEAKFSLSGQIGSTNDALCFACPLGAFDAIFVTTITDASFGTGSLTLNGVTYPDISFNNPPAPQPVSSFVLATEPFQVTHAGLYEVPFHISGFIEVTLASAPAPGPFPPLLLNTPVSGGGIADIRMAPGPNDTFSQAAPINFRFVPVPEPGSGLSFAGGLLLLGLGCLASRKVLAVRR